MLHIIFLIQQVVDLSKPGVQKIIVDPPFKHFLIFLDLLDNIQYFDKKKTTANCTNKQTTHMCMLTVSGCLHKLQNTSAKRKQK